MSMFEMELEGPGELNEWELPGETYESYEGYELGGSGELNESLEMELAQELLEITTEAELEEFLGKLVKSVGRAASGFIKSPIGKALGGVLKNVAKTALPMVGSALGSFVAPGIGTAIGGKLGSMASNLFEAGELEMMGEAEAELEMARRYVQWARGTTRYAMGAPSGVNPRTAVRAAAVSSARRYAPALLQQRTTPWRGRHHGRYQGGGSSGGSTWIDNRGGGDADPWSGAGQPGGNAWAGDSSDQGPGGQSGRWVRRGSQIILFNA